MSPIHKDGAEVDDSVREFDVDDAAAEFEKVWNADADRPSKDEPEADETADNEDTDGAADGADDTDDESSDERDDDGGEDDGANADQVVIKDDFKIKHTVDGEEREFTVGELKRLAGQEASLTRKSKEVAEKRKQVDSQAAAHVAMLDKMLERAKKKFEPYANLDFLALAKNPEISGEELSALRDAAKSAFDDVQFLEQDMGNLAEALRKQRHDELRSQAAETVKILSDPEKGIKGFNEQLYTDIVKFAVEQGIPQEVANEIVDPVSLKIAHMAMLYARGQKEVQRTPSAKKKAPKRIVKGTNNSAANKEALGSKKNAAMTRLEREGSVDAAAEAFMAGWAAGD